MNSAHDPESSMTDWPQPYTPKTYLHAFPVSGNLYDGVRAVGNLGWSDFLVQIEPYSNLVIALLRFPIDWPRDGRGPLSARQAKEKPSERN